VECQVGGHGMGAAAKVRELGPQSELVVSDKEMNCAEMKAPRRTRRWADRSVGKLKEVLNKGNITDI